MSFDGSDRYSRQILFEPIGEDGQRRLDQSRAVLIGCGALGTVLANTLVRAGVGFLRICDRDFIEPNNLQRQVLFDETDIRDNLPQAQAAANRLSRINSAVQLEPCVTDVNHTNIAQLVDVADVILDGTDNFETRYLINDVAVERNKPWVYGAVIGSTGLVMPVLPGETPCMRCVFDTAPPPEMSPTCDTAGVIGPAVNVIASLQAVEAIKILIGRRDVVSRTLASVDVWTGRVVQLNVGTRPAVDCTCCQKRDFPYLTGTMTSGTTTLCGRDAVQINPSSGRDGAVDFARIAGKLASVASGDIKHNRFLLKAQVDRYELTVFRDGRVIIKGTQSADEARSVYARYIGA